MVQQENNGNGNGKKTFEVSLPREQYERVEEIADAKDDSRTIRKRITTKKHRSQRPA